MKLYLAGALFNEGEVKQRKFEGEQLRLNFPEIDIFNPIDMPFNTNKSSLPTAIEIYENDTKAILESDIFIADLTNEDAGVLVELGIAIQNNTKIIIGINSDIRLKSANQYEIPSYAMNHYVLGGLQKHGHLVYNFQEAIDLLKKLVNK